MILLGVNVDHVATLRQARYRDEPNTFGGFVEPDPASMAWQAEDAGADGITMHVREDRRHVQVEDVQRYLERKKTRLNLEVSLSEEMVELALSLKPDSVCLVPENRMEVTTEGGLDVEGIWAVLKRLCMHLPNKAFLPACLSIHIPINLRHQLKLDPLGLSCILEVLPEGGAIPSNKKKSFPKLMEGMKLGLSLGLQVNAGHGINYQNVEGAKKLNSVTEFNIGHSIISRSLQYGLSEAVSTMRKLLNS
jgi:pyridoxine 5-phosphate synthase